jgi:hypothetical protein
MKESRSNTVQRVHGQSSKGDRKGEANSSAHRKAQGRSISLQVPPILSVREMQLNGRHLTGQRTVHTYAASR